MTGEVKEPFAEAVSVETDDLPRWDLVEEFYPEVGSPEYEADIEKLQAMVTNFAETYENNIVSENKDGEVTVTISGEKLGLALREYQDINKLAGQLFVYLSLKKADNTKYSNDQQKLQNKIMPLFSQLVFFEDDIKKIPEQDIKEFMKASPGVAYFEPWIENVRRGIPHTPPKQVQQVLLELNARSGHQKQFDDHHASKKFSFEGKELEQEEILDIVNNDPSQARRAAAFEVFKEGIKEHAALFTHVHNELIRLKMVEDRWRKFDQPWDSQHFENNIPPEVVDALEKAVKDAYPKIVHRFYALKAKLMDQPYLNMYDRNVTPFEDEKSKYIPFAEARDIVLDAYRRFSPRMADVVQLFFDNPWIDARVREGKQGGAFSMPGIDGLFNPRVLLNYLGKPRDVAVLAHELGHAANQKLAAEKDAIVETPLTLAETASVFGEMLIFRSLMAKAEAKGDDATRRELLFGKISDMINTVFRQVAFYDFEKRIHKGYRDKGGPLTTEEMGEHWKDTFRESLGPAVKVPDDYGPLFGYVPHFVHVPFYVYAYAFGEVLVDSLYRVYEEGSVPDFEKNYLDVMQMGGTLKLSDLDDKFGLDVTDPDFWSKGLKMIEEMMDELEELSEPLIEQKAQPQERTLEPT